MKRNLYRLRPGVLAGAMLFHAMVPLVPEQLPDLRSVPVFIGAGQSDSIVPTQQTEQLALMLRQAGAPVTLHWEPSGHSLNQAEVLAAKHWLRANASA